MSRRTAAALTAALAVVPLLVTALPSVAAIADYTGDGRTDIAVFRPATATWFVRGQAAVPFGRSTDVPVPADYTGDRRGDVAVFRPSTGTWFVRGQAAVAFGRATDIPVARDFTGDGRADIAVYRPATSTFFVLGRPAVAVGHADDVPVPGAWTMPNVSVPATFRPADGTWSIPGRPGFGFGRLGDFPVPGDYNGDGLVEAAVYRPTNGSWYVRGGGTAAFGRAGDLPARNSPLVRPGEGPPGVGSGLPPQLRRVLDLVNAARADNRCGPLAVDTLLTRAAQGHADDMVRRHFFAHTNPDGKGPTERAAALGYTGGVGENIAVGYADADAVMDGWMHSPGHRQNILSCDYRVIGLGWNGGPVLAGYAPGAWVQDFGF